MSVNAEPFGTGTLLLGHVVAAVADESPSMPSAHHGGPQVFAIGAAQRDRPAIAVFRFVLARDQAAVHQLAHVRGGGPTCWPTIVTQLLRLRSVYAPESIGSAFELDRVAIGDSLGTRR